MNRKEEMELLSCPFCGCRAKRVNGGIMCSNSKCAAIQQIPYTIADYDYVAAVKLWNTRAVILNRVKP